MNTIYRERKQYSEGRVDELRNRIGKLPEVGVFDNLAIFTAGSYGRLEASKHSDVDMFLLCRGNEKSLIEPRTKELRLFSKLIDIVDMMNFPKLSNDCQYLKVVHTDDMYPHLGGPVDDHQNYFTIRMLLLLESKPLYNNDVYWNIISEMVKAYYLDYPDHRQTFQPIFLLNDIGRFWKTLLLNYENKRRKTGDEASKTKHKVRNFKLKYSRMTTCFATIAALGSFEAPVEEMQVLEQVQLTPRERLEGIPTRLPETEEAVGKVLADYAWFLEQTALSEEDLYAQFDDKEKRTNMFQRANTYGDLMFQLLEAIDSAVNSHRSLLRHLVI